MRGPHDSFRVLGACRPVVFAAEANSSLPCHLAVTLRPGVPFQVSGWFSVAVA